MARTQAADYDKKRDAIMDAATRLFAERGFAAASISDLASACAVSKSLIYHYYSSKEDILYDVMSDHMDALLGVVEVEIDATPETAFRMLTKNLLSHYAGSADAQKVLLYELASLPDPRRRDIIAKQRRVITRMRSLLEAAHPALARDTARLRAKTMLYFGMLNWTHNWFEASRGLSRDALADLAADTILGEPA